MLFFGMFQAAFFKALFEGIPFFTQRFACFSFLKSYLKHSLKKLLFQNKEVD